MPAGRVPRRASLWLFACLFILIPGLARAQDTAGTIARITGDDISVTRAGGAIAGDDPRAILLASGSEIVVHSGQARIELVGGGEIGICGPTKLTLLASGGAFTLAMDFGRARVHLENAAPLLILTPLVVAMPLAIAEGPRDATVGADLSGLMCVRPARGGVRLEQQLTGDTIIVPQPEEISLDANSLRPTLAPGSCSCEILRARASPASPPAATVVASAAGPAPTASSRAESNPPAKPPMPVVREYSVPARPMDIHASNNVTPPTPPPVEAPAWKILMPPLTFDANNPAPPPAPSLNNILYVREVRVEPEWVFRGRVEPEDEPAAASARTESRGAKKAGLRPGGKNSKKSGGIGAFFRWLFGGGSRCQGAGCSSTS